MGLPIGKVAMMLQPVAAFILGLVLCLSTPAEAQTASPELAQSLALKAAALIAHEGFEAAHQEFLRDGEFKHDEIYVNVIDTNGVWRCYPPRPANEGKNVLAVQDANGRFLVKDIIALAKDKGEGWVEYRWLNPQTNRIAPKRTFVKAVPREDLIVYVGVYDK
jgi:signal transduction histidine kinase